MPLFLVLIQPQRFDDIPDFFYTGCCVECLWMNTGSEAGMVVSQLWKKFSVACGVYPLLNHFLSFFLCTFFWYVYCKIKLFDDNFLYSLLLSDFWCFEGFLPDRFYVKKFVNVL